MLCSVLWNLLCVSVSVWIVCSCLCCFWQIPEEMKLVKFDGNRCEWIIHSLVCVCSARRVHSFSLTIHHSNCRIQLWPTMLLRVTHTYKHTFKCIDNVCSTQASACAWFYDAVKWFHFLLFVDDIHDTNENCHRHSVSTAPYTPRSMIHSTMISIQVHKVQPVNPLISSVILSTTSIDVEGRFYFLFQSSPSPSSPPFFGHKNSISIKCVEMMNGRMRYQD